MSQDQTNSRAIDPHHCISPALARDLRWFLSPELFQLELDLFAEAATEEIVRRTIEFEAIDAETAS